MRKITSEAVNAFYNNETYKKSNTEVEVLQNETKFYLHGNLIAKKEKGNVYISNAGWRTNTTKERLNGLPGVNIYQKNWQWYLNGKEWNGEWTTI